MDMSFSFECPSGISRCASTLPRADGARRASAHALASARDSRVAQLHLPTSFSKKLAKLFRNKSCVFLQAFPPDEKKLGPIVRAFNQRKA
jgi:hypothetical protein